jgi:hypothetical protein
VFPLSEMLRLSMSLCNIYGAQFPYSVEEMLDTQIHVHGNKSKTDKHNETSLCSKSLNILVLLLFIAIFSTVNKKINRSSNNNLHKNKRK